MGAHGQVVLASTQQHFVARRYGELLASVFKIVESFPRQNGLKDRPTEDDSDRDQIATIDVMEKRVQELVAPLHEAMLGLLTNMAQTFPSNADKHSFLINNYDQIWTILITERGVSYRGMAQYQELAQSHIGLYVEVCCVCRRLEDVFWLTMGIAPCILAGGAPQILSQAHWFCQGLRGSIGVWSKLD